MTQYTRDEFDSLIKLIAKNPSSEQWMGGMSYLYHSDPLQQPATDYGKIKSAFLIVNGTKDSTIESCDQFVQKALAANAPITYFRIDGMEHYVRKKPDVIQDAFSWLAEQISILQKIN
ncbi:MAG: hypothetical protein S4CHLAM7_00110 [Chlamydiae bacterium]|nr:hypothetical protein [Chlamydiota bacterium]